MLGISYGWAFTWAMGLRQSSHAWMGDYKSQRPGVGQAIEQLSDKPTDTRLLTDEFNKLSMPGNNIKHAPHQRARNSPWLAHARIFHCRTIRRRLGIRRDVIQ